MPDDGTGKPHPLDHIFHPQSIAVVGISADIPKYWMRMLCAATSGLRFNEVASYGNIATIIEP